MPQMSTSGREWRSFRSEKAWREHAAGRRIVAAIEPQFRIAPARSDQRRARPQPLHAGGPCGGLQAFGDMAVRDAAHRPSSRRRRWHCRHCRSDGGPRSCGNGRSSRPLSSWKTSRPCCSIGLPVLIGDGQRAAHAFAPPAQISSRASSGCDADDGRHAALQDAGLFMAQSASAYRRDTAGGRSRWW